MLSDGQACWEGQVRVGQLGLQQLREGGSCEASLHAALGQPDLTSNTCTAPAELLPGLSSLLVGCSGIVSLGIGDTLSSVVGYCLGRCRLFTDSPKTLEGLAAGVAGMLAAWMAILWLAVPGGPGLQWAQASGLVLITLAAGLLEAATHQLDNMMVPLYYTPHILVWTWWCGLGPR